MIKDILPVYLEAAKSKKRNRIIYGGRGSGKSYFIALSILIRIILERDHNFLIVRYYSSDLEKSVFKQFNSLISYYKLDKYFTSTVRPLRIKSKFFNSEINFTGAQSVDEIKSTTDVTGVWIEEANSISEQMYKVINLSMRKKGYYTAKDSTGKIVRLPRHNQITISFNPDSPESWIKTKFIDNPPPNAYILKTTYKDNPYLDESLLEEFEVMRKTNYEEYLVDGLGEFGELNKDQLFVSVR